MKTLFTLCSILVTLSLTALPGFSAEKSGKKLFHVVSFKFKETATPEQIKAVEVSFRNLKNKISEIKSLAEVYKLLSR